jgi:hypothetical protein
MRAIIPTVSTGQVVAPTLRDLAAQIREENTVVVNALTGAVEAAIRCGNLLAGAKKQTGHGRWLEFLRACDVGERLAQQYMRLARLAEQNRTGGTDLAGMTIKGAIRLLAPPKAPQTQNQPTTKPAVAPVRVQPKRRTKHVDIIEAWLGASAADHSKAVDAIGFEGWLAAAPENWWPRLERRIAERRQPVTPPEIVPVIPDEMSIPQFLRRALPAQGTQGALLPSHFDS